MDYTKAISQALAGTQIGFINLYKKTFQKNYFLALKYMENRSAAETVMQEAYIRAFSKLDTLEYPGKFPNWFGKIVASIAKKSLKRNNPMLFSEIATDEAQEMFEYQTEDDEIGHMPEIAFTRKETIQLVYKLLDSLPEEQRMCILMYYTEGISIKQIAHIVGCSENTVKYHLRYGRDNIEAAGAELQKSGYHLYNTAPLPLLLYLLKREYAYMKADGSLMEAEERIMVHVIPSYEGQNNADISRRVQTNSKRSIKTVKSGFMHTVAGKISVGIIVLCLAGGCTACGVLQLNKDDNHGNKVESEIEPEVMTMEPEVIEEDETPAETVKEVQDAEYATLIAGNLTKEELQFVLAYGPQVIPEQGFQSRDYLDMLNAFCCASERREGEPIIEDYGPDANWVGQYSVSDVNRMFHAFTDYQLAEDNNVLSEYNVRVQDNVVAFAAANINKTSNAMITSASYTEDEMEIYYTYDYITFDMESHGLPKQIENKKAILKPNADGLYQIVMIEMLEGQMEGESVPEEQTAEQPAENAGIPVGTYSYAASAGGFRDSLTIESENIATYTTFSSGSGEGNEMKYQIVVDNSVTVPDGVTAYTFQFIEGNNIQLTENGFDVTSAMESGDNMNFSYDANQGMLQDSYGNIWTRVN